MSEINLCARYSLAVSGLTPEQRSEITHEALGWLLRELQDTPPDRQEALMAYVQQRADGMRSHASGEPPR